MKANTFTKFLVLFLALALSSCGGKDKNGDGTINGISPVLGTNGTVTGVGANQNVTTWAQMISSVAANQFSGSTQANQVMQWLKYENVTDLLNHSPNSGFNFNWCWGSECFDDSHYGARRLGPLNLGSPIYRNGTFGFDSELGNNPQELLNNLVSKMQSATNVKKCVLFQWQGLICENENGYNVGGFPSTRWYFENGNRAYVIDTQLPLLANPISILRKDTNEAFALQ